MAIDIAFKDYRKTNDIHGAVLYPAPMVAPAQKIILEEYVTENEKKKILDPFHGSGVALYEASQISQNFELTGIDINPLANLITNAKLSGVSERIERDIVIITRKLAGDLISYNKHTFVNINKWFNDEVIESLSLLKACISSTEDKKNRLFFWCIFSDIVRKYSNSRTSTYKLHIKEDWKIANAKNNVIADFIALINHYYKYFRQSSAHFNLHKCDVVTFLNKEPDNKFDICITSPPYGDNATTVPYGQYSMLALHWIDEKDVNFEGWELDNYSLIDSKSLGGHQSTVTTINKGNTILEPVLNRITKSKQTKVKRFFAGYFAFLDEMARVTSNTVILTLGNRTVDRIKIDLTKITENYMNAINFITCDKIRRAIPSKRTPRKVSKVAGESVSSMNEEYVLIMQKKIG